MFFFVEHSFSLRICPIFVTFRLDSAGAHCQLYGCCVRNFQLTNSVAEFAEQSFLGLASSWLRVASRFQSAAQNMGNLPCLESHRGLPNDFNRTGLARLVVDYAILAVAHNCLQPTLHVLSTSFYFQPRLKIQFFRSTFIYPEAFLPYSSWSSSPCILGGMLVTT